MRNNVFPRFLLASILVCLFGICFCGAQGRDSSGASMADLFARAGIRLLSEPLSPQDFSLPLTTGQTQRLSALRGKVVFLNFWATWCGPCRAEMPSMEALYGRFKDSGLEILAVNCQESREAVINFMNASNLSFPALLDRDGRVSTSYGIQGIPTTYLLNREGKIVARIVGSINWNTPQVREAIESLLR